MSVLLRLLNLWNNLFCQENFSPDMLQEVELTRDDDSFFLVEEDDEEDVKEPEEQEEEVCFLVHVIRSSMNFKTGTKQISN